MIQDIIVYIILLIVIGKSIYNITKFILTKPDKSKSCSGCVSCEPKNLILTRKSEMISKLDDSKIKVHQVLL